MGRATDLAQLQYKTGENTPDYTLLIDGARFDGNLYDASVSYAEDGTSDMTLSADADLTDLVGARVRLHVGYGDEQWEYFSGWLEEPDDNHWGNPSVAVAYGTFKELAEASLGTDVTYAGYTLGRAISDLHRRAGRAVIGTKYEFRGNPSYLLEGETAGLTVSTTFADGIDTFLEMANWVSEDRPGYIRRYRHKPRPRPNSEFIAGYGESDYTPEAFKVVRAKPYGQVGAFVRDDEGALKWPVVTVRVDAQTSTLKTYWLEDFAGTEGEAWNECAELAALMSTGLYTWSLTGISANPELLRNETIRVHTTEMRDEGGRYRERYEVTYACAIDGETSLDVSREGHPMTVGGNTAIKLTENKVKRPFYFGAGTSAVVR